MEYLYHIGVPTMMPYIRAFFTLHTKGDRPDVILDVCVNFAFLGQFVDKTVIRKLLRDHGVLKDDMLKWCEEVVVYIATFSW